VLAFFGAPVTHEDDPQRAVRAALDLVAGVHAYAAPLRESGIDLQVRVGINTGPVVVGNVGSDLRYEYTAMGDAVNVAARMQTAAAPGAIVITDATFRFVAPLVETNDLGALEVKGKSEPVRAYELTGLKATAGATRGLGAAGIESPMVGRDGPLAQLVDALGAVRAGRGRVAVVIGEPGIGKSRLLAELRRASREGPQPAGWVEGRCLSYGQQLPYHLLTDLVHSLVGTTMASEPPELRAALEGVLPPLLGEDAPDAIAFLGHLLGVPLRANEARTVALDPLTLQAGYLKSIRAAFAARARREPLVLVCEDIHWADPSSADTIVKLFPFIQETALLLVLVTRPERDAPGWRLVGQARDVFGEAMVEINLAPLTEDESRALVANLLVIESLPPRVRDFILARAEGNPFFVEEVIRMLIDRGAIVRRGDNWVATAEIEGVEIPETLQGLLLARIDRLPNDARRTLRVASVIGRQFSARVLEEVLSEGSPT
jgi:predicted ATPase